MPVPRPASLLLRPDPEASEALVEAREALGYWETRMTGLPRRAVRARKEAKDHVRRWEDRVGACERERYGTGMAGALVLLATEHRLPHRARRAGGRLARRAGRTARLLAAGALATGLLAAALLVDVLVRLLQGVGS
jgi:hypothetical protein